MYERKPAAASAMLLQRRKRPKRSGASRHVFYLLMAVFGIRDVNLDKLKMLQVRRQ
jgi:hypothetical protein